MSPSHLRLTGLKRDKTRQLGIFSNVSVLFRADQAKTRQNETKADRAKTRQNETADIKEYFVMSRSRLGLTGLK